MHKAKTISFDALLEGIEKEVQDGYIGWQQHPDYSHLRIYNYSNSCTYEKHWNLFTLCSRGLILDVKNKRIVALSFEKFFNYGEIAYSLPNEPFETFEKVDGSLIILFWYDEKWRTATRGSFNSDQAKWAQNYLYKSLDLFKLLNASKDCTYLFEAIYQENRIVVKYDYEGLVLLSGYANNGLELDCNHLNSLDFKRPKIYKHDNIENLLEIAKTLSANDEGFVVRFQSGLRIKIKGDEYCRVHRLISNCTPLAVWDSFRKCDNLNEIKKQLPEEFQTDMDNIYKILKEYFITYEAELEGLVHYYKDYTDKQLGLEKECPIGFLECVKKFVFPCRKTNFLENITKPGSDRDKFFNLFRPTSNKLEGYTPSTSINRFNNENNI